MRYQHGENTNELTTDSVLSMLSILCSICSDPQHNGRAWPQHLVLGDDQTGADKSSWRHPVPGRSKKVQIQKYPERQEHESRFFVLLSTASETGSLGPSWGLPVSEQTRLWETGKWVDLFSSGQKRNNRRRTIKKFGPETDHMGDSPKVHKLSVQDVFGKQY